MDWEDGNLEYARDAAEFQHEEYPAYRALCEQYGEPEPVSSVTALEAMGEEELAARGESVRPTGIAVFAFRYPSRQAAEAFAECLEDCGWKPFGVSEDAEGAYGIIWVPLR